MMLTPAVVHGSVYLICIPFLYTIATTMFAVIILLINE